MVVKRTTETKCKVMPWQESSPLAWSIACQRIYEKPSNKQRPIILPREVNQPRVMSDRE
jgi:hypothetical protein